MTECRVHIASQPWPPPRKDTKFAGYDLMVQGNGPWKAEVERLLPEQGKSQSTIQKEYVRLAVNQTGNKKHASTQRTVEWNAEDEF